MKLIAKTPSHSLPMDSLLNDFFSDRFLSWPQSNLRPAGQLPPNNLREDDNAWTIDLAVPGMQRKDFNIELKDDLLTISAEVEQPEENEKERYSLRQFRPQSFKRTYRLTENTVEADAIKASYENGVLSIALPKKEEAKPQPMKKIEIS